MSQTTKKAIAASLKKLTEKKPLDKITVVDIVEDCEVNRQTFYYHFQDIYDLIEWIYLSESTKVIDGKKTYETWAQGYLRVFYYVLDNKSFVMSTYHSVCRDELEKYLFNEMYLILKDVVDEVSAGLNISDENKAFVANFYKYAYVGQMLDWIAGGMKQSPEEMVGKTEQIMKGNIMKAVEALETDI